MSAQALHAVKAAQVLAGQTALVTGGSSGIGAGIALALAQAGADVAVNYHEDFDAAQDIVDRIEALGRRAIAVRADVGREEDVQRLFRSSIAALGTLDILVNNTGVQQDAAFVEMTLEQWNGVLATNLTSMFLCAQQATREFLRRGRRPQVSKALGKIICISSVHEQIAWSGHVNYAASKGGVRMLMQTLAQELAPQGIRVNSIGPGAIQTPINRDAWDTPEALQRLLKLVPYGRIGQPEDVGRAAVWLASDDSDYVVGQTLFVDGGMTLYPGFADGG